MNEKFAEKIFNAVVKSHVNIYREMYVKKADLDATNDYWKNASSLFINMSEAEKEIFFNVLEQVTIDAISGVFGVLDDSSTLEGENINIDVTVDGEMNEMGLQDSFLLFVENYKKAVCQ